MTKRQQIEKENKELDIMIQIETKEGKNVRPVKVVKAVEWLMNHSELYKNANIHIDQDWLHRIHERNVDMHEFVEQTKLTHQTNQPCDQNNETNDSVDDESDCDNFSEVDHA